MIVELELAEVFLDPERKHADNLRPTGRRIFVNNVFVAAVEDADVPGAQKFCSLTLSGVRTKLFIVGSPEEVLKKVRPMYVVDPKSKETTP